MATAQSYMIVWVPVPPSAPIGTALRTTRTFHMPVFQHGDDKRRFDLDGTVTMRDENLFCGLLLAYDDISEHLDDDTSQVRLRSLFDLLAPTLRPSPEQAIVDLASHLLRLHGAASACTALRTGMQLVPGSAIIRCDFIFTTWTRFESREASLAQVAPEIHRAYADMRLGNIALPGARKIVVYAELIALMALGKERERQGHLATDVRRYVLDPLLMQHIASLPPAATGAALDAVARIGLAPHHVRPAAR